MTIQLPVFYRHPKTGRDCLLVVLATGLHERPALIRSIASSWEVLGLRCGDEQLFVYWHDGVLRCGAILASGVADAEAQLTAFAFQAMI